MKVLVTGGTGVVGNAALLALLRDGHEVRLLSRGADRAARDWPEGVTPYPADVADKESLHGACDGMDAVLHIAGIVREDPPEVTFHGVNVAGTSNIVAEAQRAGVRRFVYVSSLGADHGTTDYHVSKLRAEEVVAASALDWTTVRIGLVFGPGDEVLSLLVRMVRTLPAIPTVGGSHKFQPIWHEDAGSALAATVARTDLNGRTLEVAGTDLITMSGVIRQLSKITGRKPLRVRLPAALAKLGAQATSAVGLWIGVDETQIQMLIEGNVVRSPDGNALSMLGVQGTPLTDALKKLVDASPEQLPGDGIGSLETKRIWADIEKCTMTAEELHASFIENFGDILAVEVGCEPGTSQSVSEGATLTMHLPARGNIQVRCVELDACSLTLLTLEGHPLAGAVRFICSQEGDCVRFEVRTYTQAADALDFAALRLLGGALQSNAWKRTVKRVVELGGGGAEAEVHVSSESLSEEESARIEEWLRELVAEKRREERASHKILR